MKSIDAKTAANMQDQQMTMTSRQVVGENTASSKAGAAPAFRASAAAELQDLDIWRIVACLPYASFAEIKQKILGLSRDRSFALNYWVKVCKLRAMKGLPMPWETIH